MSIIKNKVEDKFAIIPNELLSDNGISAKAKGVLCHLLSLPPDWKVYTEELVNHHKDGIDSINSAIKELIEAGYITREKIRDEKGHFKGYEYSVFNVRTETGKSKNGQTKNGKSKATNTNITKKEKTNSSVETPTTTSSQTEHKDEVLVLEGKTKSKSTRNSNKNKDAIDVLEYYFNKADTKESKESLDKSYWFVIKCVNKILENYSVEEVKSVLEYIYANKSGKNNEFWRAMTLFSDTYFNRQVLVMNSKKISASDCSQKAQDQYKYFVVLKGIIVPFIILPDDLPSNTPVFNTKEEAQAFIDNSK